MVNASIKELEELCYEAGKLAEQERRINISIINLNYILGDSQLDDRSKDGYISDREYLQDQLAKVSSEFTAITEKRIEINSKINEAVCQKI